MPIPGGRRSKRISAKERANLVINLTGIQKMFPCLIVDISQDGFRLRGDFKLKRGQIVEVISGADPLNAVRCSVVWVGKVGSKQEGEVGLETTG